MCVVFIKVTLVHDCSFDWCHSFNSCKLPVHYKNESWQAWEKKASCVFFVSLFVLVTCRQQLGASCSLVDLAVIREAFKFANIWEEMTHNNQKAPEMFSSRVKLIFESGDSVLCRLWAVAVWLHSIYKVWQNTYTNRLNKTPVWYLTCDQIDVLLSFVSMWGNC